MFFVCAFVELSRIVLNSIYLPSPPPVSPLDIIRAKRLVSCNSVLDTAFTGVTEVHKTHTSAIRTTKCFIRHLISLQCHQNAADTLQQT